MTHIGTDPLNTMLSFAHIYTGTWLREETACLHVFRIVSLCESTTETAVLLKIAAPTEVWRRFASESQSGVRYRKDMNDISLSSNASVLKLSCCSEHKVYATKDVWVQGNADDQMPCAEKWVVKQKRCRYKGKLLSNPAQLRQTPWFHQVPASSLTPAISRRFSLAVDKFVMTVPI